MGDVVDLYRCFICSVEYEMSPTSLFMHLITNHSQDDLINVCTVLSHCFICGILFGYDDAAALNPSAAGGFDIKIIQRNHLLFQHSSLELAVALMNGKGCLPEVDGICFASAPPDCKIGFSAQEAQNPRMIMATDTTTTTTATAAATLDDNGNRLFDSLGAPRYESTPTPTQQQQIQNPKKQLSNVNAIMTEANNNIEVNINDDEVWNSLAEILVVEVNPQNQQQQQQQEFELLEPSTVMTPSASSQFMDFSSSAAINDSDKIRTNSSQTDISIGPNVNYILAPAPSEEENLRKRKRRLDDTVSEEETKSELVENGSGSSFSKRIYRYGDKNLEVLENAVEVVNQKRIEEEPEIIDCSENKIVNLVGANVEYP